MEIPKDVPTFHGSARLSAPAYDLWVQGKLRRELGIREDSRVRVEIIGGEIVVSPGPTFDHAVIIGAVQRALHFAEFQDPAFPWRSVQNVDFNLESIAEGYIPDLVVLDVKAHEEAHKSKAKYLVASQVTLAVEVTSRYNAANDREPGPKRERPTKWNGYASVGVPYYLLVERDPRRLAVTLYSTPDIDEGKYTERLAWKFGETVTLPEPFGVEVPTDEWDAWDED